MDKIPSMIYSFEVNRQDLEVKIYASSTRSVANIVTILEEVKGVVASHTEPSQVLDDRSSEQVYKATIHLQDGAAGFAADEVLSALYKIIKQEGKHVI